VPAAQPATGSAVTTTVESKTNVRRAVLDGYIGSRSRPLRVGCTVIVVETDLSDWRAAGS
jgi:hypothetical protein